MTKEEIITVLENIARLLELKGENPFKVRAYTNGARALETLSDPLEILVAEERLNHVEGIGKTLAGKISSLVRDGRLDYYDALRDEFPPDIMTLFELHGVGPKKIKAIWEHLHISSLTALDRACKDGRIAAMPGFGEKTAENILRSIEQRKRSAGRFLISEAAEMAERLKDDLRSHDAVTLSQVAGSYRRRKEIIGDLDFIVSSRDPGAVSAFFTKHPVAERILAEGPTKSSIIVHNGLQCDLRVVKAEEYPFALSYFTGSKEHNVRLRSRALDRGWSLNEYRFSVAEGKSRIDPIPEIHDEPDIYRALGLDYVEPELREDRGEFEAAQNHKLPRLVEWTNLRGTFHAHTTASDGRASLVEMALAARELGLEYIGIADHSKSSIQANGLDEKRLAEQGQAIRQWNARSEGIHILAGVECDILRDGSLDFSADTLSSLDFVVASVHASFNLTEAEMTARVIRAIENPHVTMLGHITGRLLLTREPYKINIPAVIEAAAQTKTLIEINANPRRLELDWRWLPLAKEKGARFAINPDAHSTRALQHLLLGVGIARKGWLTQHDIVNCLPLGRIASALQAKRS